MLEGWHAGKSDVGECTEISAQKPEHAARQGNMQASQCWCKRHQQQRREDLLLCVSKGSMGVGHHPCHAGTRLTMSASMALAGCP